ncbi:type II secretion system F family protein [Starkeya sp. ORNL1]|uniref:type II secretion system F family protein n=1 Tax=Starkeya sp. ORNL1 TaxID=2709380 RepID=UPI0014647411|nr:type II secretion system F family protein [Starkeya sp. ORNL1]QJP15259.1 type II secretion system F family protein [Starkeya sp. ORNL1]
MEGLWVPLLATLAAGGLAYVFIFPLLSGERAAERRMRDVAMTDAVVRRTKRGAPDPAVTRRQQVEESLKELDARRRNARRPPLQVRITQAGLTWSRQRFLIISVVLGILALLLAVIFRWPIYLALGVGFVAGFGLPRWLLNWLKKRREQKFLREFPNAVDVIVRGVKSGLPLGDCIRVVASESQEPVRGEFRHIVETQALGIPLSDACARLFERVPLAETSFFTIVVSIQAKSGGNLSETLGNLSRVLRERRKMQEKIQAMSMEAKASAAIIGSLPIAVMLLVYLSTPSYIALLWTEPLGRLMLAGSAFWMFTGILVMRKMINFDF